MKIIDLVEELDQLITLGHIMDAFEHFFADDVVTHSADGNKSEGKTQKRNFLQNFFGNITATDEIKLHGSLTDNNTTYSAFTFKFRNKQNEVLVWNEIIRRIWQDGKVVDEYYFEGDMAELKTAVAALAANKEAEVTPPPEPPKRKSPAVLAEPIKKASQSKAKAPAKRTKTTTQDNLKLVEGIGPKIEKLLITEGIKTFADLAKTRQPQLKAILAAAGPRFSMHSPRTWPRQAKLLATGKEAELKQLQDELRGGRVV